MMRTPLGLLLGASLVSSAVAQNDECQFPTAVGLGSISFNTSAATLSPEPWSCGIGGGPDLWYSYTAPNNDTLRIETCGSGYDTVLEVFTGTCGALTTLECNDDGCGLQSSVTISSPTAGTTYLFRVGGYNGAFGSGTITVSAMPPLVANDECTGAIPVVSGSLTMFSTVQATASAPAWSCAVGSRDVWYEYTSASTADIRFATCGSSFDTALEVFTGTCGALTLVACNDDACGIGSEVVVTNPAPGAVYYARVGGFNGASGAGGISVDQVSNSPASLVAHWTMDDLGTTCADVGGVGIPGTYVGGTPGAAGAAPGTRTSVDFSAPDHVVIPAHPALDQLRNDLSVAAWIRPETLPVSYGRIFGNMAPGGSWSFALSATGGLRFTIHAIQDYNFGTGLIAAQQWTHVAVTMDALNDVHFYVNGALLGSVAGSSPSNAPTSSYVIGVFGPSAPSPEYFDGQIDDVQVYDGVLTPEEVVQLYSNPATNLGANNPVCCGYCGGNPNSTGQVARVSGEGTSTLAENNYQLIVDQLPQNAFAFFLCSTTQDLVLNPAGSQGNLCLGGSIGRYVGPGEIRNSGLTGAVGVRVDFTRMPSPTGFVSAAPGERWNFQLWYRDSVGGAATSNFSDGRTVMVQ